MKKRVWAMALAVSMICSLVGCGSSKGPNTTPEEEKERVQCIAETDYPLKNLKVSGSEAMYEITTADLGLSEALVSMAVRVGNDLAVVYDGAKLALIDPLNLKIKATLDMSSEIEGFDQVLATDHEIAAVCYELNKVQFYNSSLELVDEIPVIPGRNAVKLSTDLKKIIWDNDAATELYVYDRDTKTQATVCSELASKYTHRGLSGYDGIRDQIYFDIRDEDDNFIETQVWNVNDGTIAYTFDYPVDHLVFDENYMYGRYLKNDETDCLIKDMEHSTSYIIAVDGIYECGSKAADLPSRMVCTSDLFATADTSNKVTFTLYGFDGSVAYKTEYATDERNQVVNSANVNQNQKYAALIVSDDCTNHLLIWDFLAQESQSDNHESHLYEIDALNDEKIDDRVYRRAEELENKYGFELHMGDDYQGISDGEYAYTPIYNEAVIMRSLTRIDSVFSRYPEGLINQVDSKYRKGMQIYLLGGIAGVDSEINDVLEHAGGFAGTGDGSATITVDITIGEFVFYHELAHILHRCMNQVGTIDMENPDTICPDILKEDVWETYNPKGYVYPWEYTLYDNGGIDDRYICQFGGNPNDWYFARSYSKVSMSEDVATLMEAALLEQTSPTGFFESPALQNKLKYLSECIRSGFDTTGWPEKTAWELLLK